MNFRIDSLTEGGSDMEPAIVRIYMPATAKYTGKRSFWQRIFGAPLASYLLREAKNSGIEQALFLRVQGGFLKGQKIKYESVEAMPPDFPQCVELVDEESKVRGFIDRYREHLGPCRVFLCKGSQLIPAVGS